MAARIEVIVKPDGTLSIEGKGFSGADCFKATKFLEDALGVKTSDTRTKEYYNQASQSQQNKAQQ